jgi:hypothetical protein
MNVRLATAGLLLAVLAAAAWVGACSGDSDSRCMPPAGGLKGGYEVRINGEGFDRGSMVLFGGKPVKDVKYIGAEAIAVQAPPGDSPGDIDIVVTSPKGTRTIFPKAFTYTAMPGLDVESTARPGTAAAGSAAPKTGGAEEYKPSSPSSAPSGGSGSAGAGSGSPSSAPAAPSSAK